MKKILTLLAAAVLTACQTPTHTSGSYTGPHRVNPLGQAPAPYVPFDSESSVDDLFHGGYRSKQLAPGLYKTAFMGNSGTPRQVAKDSAFYRAAEVTVNSGYRYFRILESQQDGGRHYLSSGDWIEVPFYIFTFEVSNTFTPESIDASRLITSLGTAYAAR